MMLQGYSGQLVILFDFEVIFEEELGGGKFSKSPSCPPSFLPVILFDETLSSRYFIDG